LRRFRRLLGDLVALADDDALGAAELPSRPLRSKFFRLPGPPLRFGRSPARGDSGTYAGSMRETSQGTVPAHQPKETRHG
jgi:hypothetical protein